VAGLSYSGGRKAVRVRSPTSRDWPCWFTMDPASLLVTSHFNDFMPEIPPEWGALEYYQDDVNNLADVANSTRGISTLHEATGGDPTISPHRRRHLPTARIRR
jgi:hypothetical protein